MAIYTHLTPAVPSGIAWYDVGIQFDAGPLSPPTATLAVIANSDGTETRIIGTGFIFVGGEATAGTISEIDRTSTGGGTVYETVTGLSLSLVTLFGAPDDGTAFALIFANADTFHGFSGNDTLNGGAGNDTIGTGAGSNLDTDNVDGGAGDDQIHIETGTKDGAIAGGADNDRIYLDSSAFSGSIDGGTGSDTLIAGTVNFASQNFTGATFQGIETTELGFRPITIDTVQAGNLGSIDLTATTGTVTLAGTGTGIFGPAVVGNGETLTINASAAGGEIISFAPGSQITGTGKVVFNGGAGNDSFNGTEAADTINGGTGNDTLNGGAGNDTIGTGAGSNLDTDNVDGGAGDDQIHIETATKDGAIAGGADNDRIYLDSSAFSGSIDGGTGSDTLIAGTANFASQNFTGATFQGIETTELGFRPITIDTVQAGNLGSIDLTATTGTVTLAGTGTGIFGPAVVGNGETLTINASAAGGEIISFAPGSQITGTGKVVFNGGAGNDSFNGTEAADTINGGAGNDTLNGGAGNDTIGTGAGSNLDTDNVDGGAGDDQIHIETGTKDGAIAGGADNDRIYLDSSAFSGSIDGGTGSDTLIAGTANFASQNFTGATFQGIETTELGFRPITIDTVQAGNLGSIDLTATTGTVTLAGTGTGIFGPAVVGNGETLTINASAAGGEIISFAPGSQITGTGKVVFNGGAGNDSFNGTEAADTINGGAGNDTLNGGAGNDTIGTGAGSNLDTDNVDGGAGDDQIHIETGTKDGAIAGGADNDRIYLDSSAFSGSIDGGTGSDTLIAGTANFASQNFTGATFQGIETTELGFRPITIDTVQAGNLGSIDLTATTGTVTLAGTGTGIFGPAVVGNGETLTINASAAGGEIISFAPGSQITGTGKVVLNGGAGNDSFNGTEAADTINGGTGNDTLNGGAGNDTIGTGAGSNLDTDNVDGGAGDDQIHIETGTKDGAIAGGADNDRIYLDSSAFSGSIDGGTGSDTLIAGTANFASQNFTGATFQGIETTELGFRPITIDTVQAGNLGSIDLTATTGTVTLAGTGTGIFGPAVVGNGETLTINASAAGGEIISFAPGSQITGTGKVVFNGGAGNDSFNGTEAADTINGGAGNDTLNGGAGNDVVDGGAGTNLLNGGPGSDTVSYASAAAGITARLDLGFGQHSVDGLFDTYISIENVIGSNFGDTLVGLDGVANTLDGGNGDDFLYGEGIDTVIGGAGNDVFFGGQGSALNINLATSGVETVWGSFVGDVMDGSTATAKLTMVGQGLTGGANADTMMGGSGDDFIYYRAGDVITGGSGNDWAVATLSSTGATLNMTTTGFENAWGSTSDDTITAAGSATTVVMVGDTGNDTLTGGNAGDFLYGFNGNDTLTGGGGNDNLIGGAGTDTFVFGANWGTDIVWDWQDGSEQFNMQGSGAANFAALAVNQNFSGSGNALISFGANQILVVGGANHIDAGDFIF